MAEINDMGECVKCGEGAADGPFNKCFEKGYFSLISSFLNLGYLELLEIVQTRWSKEKLRIHSSCRIRILTEERNCQVKSKFFTINDQFSFQ